MYNNLNQAQSLIEIIESVKEISVNLNDRIYSFSNKSQIGIVIYYSDTFIPKNLKKSPLNKKKNPYLEVKYDDEISEESVIDV